MMSQRPRPRWYCFQTCTLRPQSKCRYLYCIVEACIGLIGYFYLFTYLWLQIYLLTRRLKLTSYGAVKATQFAEIMTSSFLWS